MIGLALGIAVAWLGIGWAGYAACARGGRLDDHEGRGDPPAVACVFCGSIDCFGDCVRSREVSRG